MFVLEGSNCQNWLWAIGHADVFDPRLSCFCECATQTLSSEVSMSFAGHQNHSRHKRDLQFPFFSVAMSLCLGVATETPAPAVSSDLVIVLGNWHLALV